MRQAPKVPPLVVLAIAFVVVWALHRLQPMPPSPPLQAAGGFLVAIAIAIAAAGVMAFRRARTTVDPINPERVSTLVSDGIYRVTRNPMYLGFVLMLGGWTLALGSAAGLVVLLSYAVYLDRFQIPPEEHALRSHFGAEFDAYAARVRRWL
jgi:protein-S-isoprenylcysteine O-methyltransferase Ste14